MTSSRPESSPSARRAGPANWARARALAITAVATIAQAACTQRSPVVAPGGEGPAGDTPTQTEGTSAGDASAPVTAPKPVAVPAGRHPFSVRDLLAMERVGAPVPSPDGAMLVFTVRATDLEGDRGWTDLWTVPSAGGTPTRLLLSRENEATPTWAPNGKEIFYLSSRSGSMQVWAIEVRAGATPRQVTALPLDVGSFAIAPAGDRLAVSMEVFVDCPTLACTTDRLSARAADKSSGQHYDHLFVRHWDTWKDGRRSHLFVVPIGGGDPVDVTRGMDADVPSKPFGGAEDYAFSPDGATLAFSARDVGAHEAWSTNFDIFLVPSDGSTKPVAVTASNPAWDAQPRFSADGKQLLWLAMARPGYEADRFVLHRATVQGRSIADARPITGGWDRSIDDWVLAPDGRRVIASAQDVGNKRLFAIELDTGKVETLTADPGTHAHPAFAGDRLVFTRNDLRHPDEIFVADASGQAARALTQFNAARLDTAEMGEPEQFSFRGAKGETVHAWIVKPVGFRDGTRYPVAYLIHGGPQGSFSNNFHYRWNPQTYAGAGLVAIMVDFHGSTGYGQKFTDAIRDDWGGAPLVDLQKGLAAASERYSFVDGDRVCALGASYGGFMINWIAGRWPKRFRCLVNHDGLFDHRSMYYTTEELWFPEWEHGGPYYEKTPAHEKHNPSRYVQAWVTPMLVIQGGLDFRVPTEQGLATFTALQRRGVPSELLYFPDENHWVLKPNNAIRWHETVEAWLARHLSTQGRSPN